MENSKAIAFQLLPGNMSFFDKEIFSLPGFIRKTMRVAKELNATAVV